MFDILLYGIIFFAIPIILITLFFVSLCRYISAKSKNKAAPGSFSDVEIKKRRITLIVLSVIAGILIVVVVGYIGLILMSIAFM